MSGIVGSRLNIRGSGLIGNIGTDGQVLTSSGAGQEIVFESVSSGAVTAINNATANELVTIGSTTTELDAEANLTFDGTNVLIGGTGKIYFNDAGGEHVSGSGSVLSIAGGSEIDLTATAIDINGTADVSGAFTAGSTIVATGSITGTTIEPNADTSAGDNAAIGYTSAEGLILTGQGSTNDVTLKNDADTTVLEVATGAVDVEITAGNIIMGTSGKGIDFSATADGTTMGSELLDDYEEGSWTPTWVLGTSGTCNTANASGKYVKVGALVTLWGYNAFGGTVDDPQGSIKIGGLPFTPADGYGQSNAFFGQGWCTGGFAWGNADGSNNSAADGYHPRAITVRTDGLQLVTFGVTGDKPWGPSYDLTGQTKTMYGGSSNHGQVYFGAVYRVAA